MNINERHLANRSGGNFTTHKDFMDSVTVARMPYNETQVLTGLSASDGVVIPDTLIPANVKIGDNLKLSNGAYNTAANQGGIVTEEGTAVTGFILAGTFVHDMVVLTDDYGNPLNMVSLREEATHDPVTDDNGREVLGLLVRVNSVADDTAVAENPDENLEICFVVNDGTGAYAKATGGVTGDIEFHLNRAISKRWEAKIQMLGGNALGLDVISNLDTVHFTDLEVTAPYAVDEVITISTGAGGVSGTSDVGGDVAPVTLNVDSATFVLDNTCIMTLDGVKGSKGVGKNFAWESALAFSMDTILDIGDRIGIERKYV